MLVGRKDKQNLSTKPTSIQKSVCGKICLSGCASIKNCSSHIIRLKEEMLLHEHNEVQVSKGSTSLLSGYSELCLCLQALNWRNYGTSSLLEKKKERKKPNTQKVHRKTPPEALNQRTFLGCRREGQVGIGKKGSVARDGGVTISLHCLQHTGMFRPLSTGSCGETFKLF